MIHTTIAHYRITAKIGKGGMGEVYRATDTKLDRDVAIKILPESFAGDRNRLARFHREAKALATLNHPNIAVIHGIEQHQATQALVMELIEGETLGQRLQREPMSVTEALECCKQIAEALEAAHEKGIIHRDLKPENVKISDDGHVKVLDFGLAKEVVDPAAPENQAESPTVTHMTTGPGELLGTAPYMSPEQARARPVDKRSDIWSFGCVLYECLTGKPMFHGDDVTETLASIIKGEPDWSALPSDTPPTIELLLRKCLNKDRKRRLRDIGDARIDIEQAFGDPSSSIIRLSDQALEASAMGAKLPGWLYASALVIVAMLGAVLVWFLKPGAELRPIRQISMHLGTEVDLPSASRHGTAFQLSPDGSALAFLSRRDDDPSTTQLFLRPLDALDAIALEGAESLDQFCYSPDGQWIAFRDSSSSELKKIAVSGGLVITLCPATGAYGIDWGDDDWIVFAERSGGLWRVPAAGGQPEALTTIPEDADDKFHRWPACLPGSGAVMYSSHVAQLGWQNAKIMIKRLTDGKTVSTGLMGCGVRYLPTGHLVFDWGGTLFCVGFDVTTLEVRGNPVPLIQGIANNGRGASRFDVSGEGTLVYLKNNEEENGLFTLEWVDRAGTREPLMPPAKYNMMRFSPDGRSLAYFLNEQQRGIWIYDFQRGMPRKFSRDPAMDIFPVWHPDGSSIAFGNSRNGPPNLSWRAVGGDGEVRHWTNGKTVQFPVDWHPDGDTLLVFQETVQGGGDLRLFDVESDDPTGLRLGSSEDFLGSRFSESDGRFSPEGEWVAYVSDESGMAQVYVCRFPGGGSKTQVTFDAQPSTDPVWSQTSKELLFRRTLEGNHQEGQQVLAVKYTVDNETFLTERPIPWAGTSGVVRYELHPDGNRLLMQTPVETESRSKSDHIVLMDNFDAYLRQQLSME